MEIYSEVNSMKKKKVSISEKILALGIFLNKWRTAEEIQKEIKDRTGYTLKVTDIRVNLLYMLRGRKFGRVREGKIYRYKLKKGVENDKDSRRSK